MRETMDGSPCVEVIKGPDKNENYQYLFFDKGDYTPRLIAQRFDGPLPEGVRVRVRSIQ